MINVAKIVIVALAILLAGVPVHPENKEKTLKLFIAEEFEQNHNLILIEYYEYNLRTKEKTKIIKKPLESTGLICISTDGKYLLYYDETNENKFIRIIDAKSEKQIVDKPVSFEVFDKSITTNYVIMNGATGRWADSMDIYLYNIKTDELKRITNNDVRDYNPVISYDSEALFFLQENEDLTKTYLKRMVFDSDKVETLHIFEGTAYRLYQCLNDGKLLMTKRDNEGTPFLWDLETKESIEYNLDRISDIMISPDGKKMFYLRISEIGPYCDLYVSDVDGSNREKIEPNENWNILSAQWVMN